MKVIALAQRKGGCGKSTLAIHIACEAGRHGIASTILELDGQGTASLWDARRQGPPRVSRIDTNELPQVLEKLKKAKIKLVVLDCPGSHSPALAPAIKAANLVLLPTRPHEVDIAASAETLAMCQRLEKPHAYVLSLCPPTGQKAAETRAAFEASGYPVTPVDVVHRAVFADAIARGRTAFEIEPGGKAAAEIAALWAWIKKELRL